MFREMIHILQGASLWYILRIRFRITEKKVVIILVNDNEKLDYYTIVHLKNYMDRKCADGALILLDHKKTYRMVRKEKLPSNVKISRFPRRQRELLYDFYSFYKFSDKVVFTYVERPKDNQLGRVLRETQINEEDAVCLGLYHLRIVPAAKNKRAERLSDV